MDIDRFLPAQVPQQLEDLLVSCSKEQALDRIKPPCRNRAIDPYHSKITGERVEWHTTDGERLAVGYYRVDRLDCTIMMAAGENFKPTIIGTSHNAHGVHAGNKYNLRDGCPYYVWNGRAGYEKYPSIVKKVVQQRSRSPSPDGEFLPEPEFLEKRSSSQNHEFKSRSESQGRRSNTSIIIDDMVDDMADDQPQLTRDEMSRVMISFSKSRTRPLNMCDTVGKLFTQAKATGRVRSQEGDILLVRASNDDAMPSVQIVHGDDMDFAQLIKAIQGSLKRKGGKLELRVDVVK